MKFSGPVGFADVLTGLYIPPARAQFYSTGEATFFHPLDADQHAPVQG